MKKIFLATTSLFIVLLMLAGCSSKLPLPDGMDKDTLTTKAKETLTLMTSRDYDALSALFAEDLPAQVLEESIAPILDRLGDFEKFGKISTTGFEENDVIYGTALVECVFSKGKGIWTVFYTPDWVLGGLRLVG